MSPQKFLPFALPDIGEEEIAAVVEVLRSGWITTGPKTQQFERKFGEYLGPRLDCVAVNSATAGLHLALESIGIGPGDEVIVPTHTFTATAEVVRYLGADPVFVDIDLRTYCIDPAAVDAAVTGRTKLLMPVHYAGLASDMDALQSIAARHSLRIVEDAAHAFPTIYKGRLVGTLDSDCTVFSFYATKTIATGEGGMLVTRDPTLSKRARVMRLHGIDRDAFDRYAANRPAWYYEVIAPGFKYNLTDVASAMGLEQLAKINRFQARREEMAANYFRELSDLPLDLPPQPGDGSSHAWHLYVVRVAKDCKIERDAVIQALFEAGIGCSVHYVPLHLQPYWRDRYRLHPEQFPNSQLLYERGLSLPIYTRMTDSDQGRVIDALRNFFRNA